MLPIFASISRYTEQNQIFLHPVSGGILVLHPDYLTLERDVTKLSLAIMTRNRWIVMELMAGLKANLSQQEMAGLVLISLERLLWIDPTSLQWAVQSLIPDEVMQEIHQMTSFALYQRLIRQGFIPGENLSVDAGGRILVKSH